MESMCLELPNCKSNNWMTSIEIIDADNNIRNQIMLSLKDYNVDSRPVFSPMRSLPMFTRKEENPVAYRIGKSAINIPSGHDLTQDQIDHVCEVLIQIL